MPLINFGAILGFAEQIETDTYDFLSGALAKKDFNGQAGLFEMLKKNSAKRIKEIQRTRRENVTEMILESIDGFYRGPFEIEPQDPKEMSAGQISNAGAAMFERCVSYYTEAAVKLKGQSEVSRALKTLAKKTKRDLENIKEN